MILATGGIAVGEISMRSKFASSAALSASANGITPKLAPSAPITRSSLTRIALLILVLSLKMTRFEPTCQLARAVANTRRMYHRYSHFATYLLPFPTRRTLAADGLDVVVEVLFAIVIGELLLGLDIMFRVDMHLLRVFVDFCVAVWFATVVDITGNIFASGSIDHVVLVNSKKILTAFLVGSI